MKAARFLAVLWGSPSAGGGDAPSAHRNELSGNPDKTPRYNYNQRLYRLDLSAEALGPAHGD